MNEIKTKDYCLTPISKKRYKIEVFSFQFQKTHANKIQGCYFSGPQKSWVMPQNKTSLNQFIELFPATSKKDIPKQSYDKALKDFIDQLTLKRYSENTIVIYKDQIRKFFSYFPKSNPSDLTDEHVKEYMLYLLNKKKISFSYQKQVISAIKFYFEKILRRETKSYYFEIPKTKERKLPVVLSKNEISLFFSKLNNQKYLALFSTIYASGLRISEAINLKIQDIDSERMLIYIRGAKGMKDRITVLSIEALTLLREYYKNFKPETWLFEIANNKQFNPRTIQKIFHQAFDQTGIRKKATVHTLRHSFATHLLENGEDIRNIQKLLGHKNLKTPIHFFKTTGQATEIYTHVTSNAMQVIKSPFDSMNIENKENE